MQLVTQAIESLKQGLVLYDAADCKILREFLIPAMNDAVKYVVPDPSKLGITVKNDTKNFLRCPYPVFTIEYQVEADIGTSNISTDIEVSKSSKRIALVIDLEQPSKWSRMFDNVLTRGFVVVSIYYIDKDDEWLFSTGYAHFDPESEFEALFSDSGYQGIVTTYALKGFEFVDRKIILNDVAEEYCTTLRVLAMLNARNVRTVLIPTSPKLNKKRARNSKTPFFEYKVLDVFLSDVLVRKVRLVGKHLEECVGSFITGRKLGTVTGHFKHRASGMYFWRTHQRGNAKKGVVVKDYALHRSNDQS